MVIRTENKNARIASGGKKASRIDLYQFFLFVEKSKAKKQRNIPNPIRYREIRVIDGKNDPIGMIEEAWGID